jgi:hypothetical protein
MKIFFYLWFVFLFFVQSEYVAGFSIDKNIFLRNESNKNIRNHRKKDVRPFFSLSSVSLNNNLSIVTDPINLQSAARDTLNYIEKNEKKKFACLKPPSFTRNLMSLHKVKMTLQYLIDIIDEDKKTGIFRILDPSFIKKQFGFISWHADINSAKKNNVDHVISKQIYLTNYAVYIFSGSYNRTKKHPYALYRLFDKKAPSYTKQQIIGGALNTQNNKKKTSPLVWLSREGVEEALMQGTIFVCMPNKIVRIFNIDRNNNIPYDKKIKNRELQKRYWYFKERSHGKDLYKQYKKRGNVLFAGDIENIGIGKVITIKHKNVVTKKEEVRLGILADTGGAFYDNLYQLDFFAGVFKNKALLKEYMKQLPNTTSAYVLYKL